MRRILPLTVRRVPDSLHNFGLKVPRHSTSESFGLTVFEIRNPDSIVGEIEFSVRGYAGSCGVDNAREFLSGKLVERNFPARGFRVELHRKPLFIAFHERGACQDCYQPVSEFFNPWLGRLCHDSRLSDSHARIWRSSLSTSRRGGTS